MWITDLENITRQEKSIVTIGTFDGIHLGHRHLIGQLVRESESQKARSVVLTFEPHPQTVIRPERSSEIKVLATLDEKKDLLQELGLNTLIVAKFDRLLAQKTGEQFVKEILLDKIGLQKCIIGHDHVFGKNRSGNFQLLQTMGRSNGFEVEQIEAFESNGKVINSTQIRKFIQQGNVEAAGQWMGREYSLSGRIIKGDGRGKLIRFPTANFEIKNPQKLIPMNGVYATSVVIDNRIHRSVSNVGSNPTFKDSGEVSIETHVLDFDGDLYHKQLELRFLYRIRDEKTFSSADELIREIQKDIDFAIKRGFSII